jgi:hypothetical protein
MFFPECVANHVFPQNLLPITFFPECAATHVIFQNVLPTMFFPRICW